MLESLGMTVPIIQAPMAGSATTTSLVIEVTKAGALGSFAAGYLSPEHCQSGIKAIKALTAKPFAVNLFVPQKIVIDEDKIKRMIAILNVYRNELQLPPMEKFSYIPDAFAEKIEILIREDIKVFSFTFGIPEKAIINKLKQREIYLIGTATTVDEAIALESAGCDAVVAQGIEAGGHRGTFLSDFSEAQIGTLALIPQVVAKIKIPVIAAGGIMNGQGVLAALALGASAVQMGTAFLTCKESGISDVYKKLLLTSNDESTVITKVFSGKPARGIRNRLMSELEKYVGDIPEYPLQHFLTHDIRTKAAELDKADFLSLWSGQAASLCRNLSVADLMAAIKLECQIAAA